VALARGMLSAAAETLGIDGTLIDDVNIAVSEACNNVVLHAYGSAVGPLVVDFRLDDFGIEVIVSDRGVGIVDRAPSEGRLGVGLALMEALADRAEFTPSCGGGTDVLLSFACQWRWPGEFESPVGGGSWQSNAALAGDVVVRVCELPLLDAVMGRLTTMVAASARFSIDRLSDVRLMTDAIAADSAEAAPRARIGFALSSAVRTVELTVGPFDGTAATRLRERLTSPAASLPLRLLNELKFERSGAMTVVRAVIDDPRSGPVGPPAR